MQFFSEKAMRDSFILCNNKKNDLEELKIPKSFRNNTKILDTNEFDTVLLGRL